MNAGAPTCSTCGGLNTNPQAMQCRFCGQALAPQAHGAPQGYGGAPGGYAPHGAQHGYYAPQAYGAPQGYGAPQPYGAAQAYGPANPYGGPQPNPYAQQVPVAGFGGSAPYHGGRYVNQSGWASGWSTFVWVRLIIAAVAIGISLLGACVSALGH